jgi:uncharacterized membrane protein YagU involved in acid resistance
MIRDAIRGAVAGAAATWLMDLVTTRMYEAQPPEVTRREQAAQPNGKSSVANMVDRFESATGLRIPSGRRSQVESAVHYALGIVPAAVYGVLRRRLPIARLWEGAGFGLVVFALNDEYLNTRLGLAGPVSEYPAQTHVRGLAGHVALGLGTETGIQLLGG